ncbi:hypothetical protein ATJ88_1356 [Isoptericola jiangsuensis]|uniref:Uncharacterized protein n=1 Tax=Isoptericola jiangsuensis TaxID=548579 RepID=A0A2A9EVT9_9MICO|nr:hypothetical protein [Isoptericola jiangsuensis]PFG42686.1 hypothetical protein ATJ88_1356 [Isoptericola jiangsuensis]
MSPARGPRLPTLPHPHLIWLRSAATIVLSCVVAQAGWAAALLGGQPGYLVQHRAGAWVTLAAAVAAAGVYVVLRRSAGPVNVALALAVAVLVAVQVALGELGVDFRSVHIFTGVLLAMLVTALTSWTYRHRLPGSSAGSSSTSPRSV